MRTAVFVALAAASWILWFARPPAPRPPVTPLPRQVSELVYGPAGRIPSYLWLVALGVPRLTIADGGKYASLLETDYEDPAGWRTYRVPVRNPAPALLVSRYHWKRLPRVQSLYDRRALQAYVQWANRPEAAGFRWTSRRTAEVRADLGPDDLILVRRFADGWRASAPMHRDPIGYLLLDPGAAGPVTVTLTAPLFPVAPTVLPTHAAPYINPGGVLSFPEGIVTIYGQDLGGSGPTRVFAGGRPADVLWAGENQVNARLPRGLPPGPAPLVVEHGGGRSEPYLFEARP
jgi:hypothetical protein